MTDAQDAAPMAEQFASVADTSRLAAEVAQGQRAYLESLGFSPTAAETMAVHLYIAMLGGAK